MHKTVIPQALIDSVIARRGKEHVFDDLIGPKTALVVVDLQNAFMLEEVAHAFIPAASSVVPNVNRLAAAVRQHGGKVVWIQTVWAEATAPEWSVLESMSRPEWVAKRIKALSRHSKGWELWPKLEVKRDEDLIVEKLRFSAFNRGSSNLDTVLKEHGMENVLITGAATNVCCESTARDSMMMNYKTIMITDANAAGDDEQHNSTITNFYSFFGDVMSTDFAIECLERNGKV